MAEHAAFLSGSAEIDIVKMFTFTLSEDATLRFSKHVVIDQDNFMGPKEKKLVKGAVVVLYQGNRCKLEFTNKKTS